MTIDHLAHDSTLACDIGDLDLSRNLKLRSFVKLVLAPVFRDLQPRLRYADMGKSGITAMQYYADFENVPAEFGYGNDVAGHYEIRLCRSCSEAPRGSESQTQQVERLILETRATLRIRQATAPPVALGFEPPLGTSAVAGVGRVLHVLTRSQNPPGQRWVNEIPPEIDFLEPHPLEGAYPTIPLLLAFPDGIAPIAGAKQSGIWGLANSDVYQHIHAREYIFAMENAIAAALAEAAIPQDSYAPLRARMIFRRPYFIGQGYTFSVRLFRRDAEILAIGAFAAAGEDPLEPAARPAVVLRFEGRLAQSSP
jgi:hypothetical protein